VTFTSPELHLVRLLSERFDVREVHRTLVGLSDEAPLKARLMEPTSTTPLAFATHAVFVLTAGGHIQRPLFAALVSLREALAGEIWGVAALFGVSHTDAAPVDELPEHFAALAEAQAALRTFIGRVEQLELLRAVLLPPSGPPRAAYVCNLQGMAGVGKSFLVERFYADHLASFPGGHLKITLWVDAAPTAEGLLSDLAERLGVLQGPGRVEERVRGAALAARPLVHLDNLDDELQAEAAVALVRRLPGVPIVLSGRYQFGKGTPGWQRVNVDPFSVSDALVQLGAELVVEVAERVDDDARRTLVGALGGLPLAIHLAASYLNAGYEVQDFLGALAASGLSLKPFTASDTAYLDRAERALHATFDLSLQALRAELGEEADAGALGVAALSVAPLAGVGRSWMEAIVGGPKGKAFVWVSLAVKLSIVQHDVGAGRWRVHKLLGEHLRRYAEAKAAIARRAHKLLGVYLRSHADAEAAIARMDWWVLERLPKEPTETSGARWRALQAEHAAVAEWVAGLDGERAVALSVLGCDYALVSGPYAVWLGAVTRGLNTTTEPKARSELLWCQSNLARQAGDLELSVQAAKRKGEHDAVQGWDRDVALAAALRADVLQARGQLDEALRIRWDEEVPAFKRLGDVRSMASAMGRIADVLQARGQFDEALRIRREEQLPAFERLGDVHGEAVTKSRIADVLQARGQLDEALRIYKEEVLPVYNRLGDIRGKAVTIGKIADVLQTRGLFDEALRIRWEEQLPVYERLDDIRGKAITKSKIADVLQARGQLDEALRIRWNEEIPIYERLGDVFSKAVTMGKIADVLRAWGQLDEALRIHREEEIPVYEKLGDVRSRAVTMGKIATVLQAQGKLDEALSIRREEVVPALEALGDRREVCAGRTNLAALLLTRGHPADVPEARALLLAALAAAIEMNLPREVTAISTWLHRVGLHS